MAKKKTDIRQSLLVKAMQNPVDRMSIDAVAQELNNNPLYSLEVDPLGEQCMSEKEKAFTKWYIAHRNVAVAAQLADITVEDGMAIYRTNACQEEIQRIGMAYRLRQLNNNMLSLDQMGSMLTGYIFNQMPEADQLNTKGKMDAMKMIMDIHALKQKVIEDAEPVDVIEVEEQIKDMSVDALKSLIEQTKSMDDENDEKEDLINQIDEDSTLTNDDLRYLRSLSVDELKALLIEKMSYKKKAEANVEETTVEVVQSDLQSQLKNCNNDTDIHGDNCN